MKSIVIICTFGALVNARPEAGFGYKHSYPNLANWQYPTIQNYQALPDVLNINSIGQDQNTWNVDNYYPSPVTANKPATVHKHVYFHAAPEEPQEIVYQKPIVVPPPQKHYKIILVKAPAPPKPTAPYIPAQPQNEEKTLVYVLVKKPEAAKDVIIPTPLPTSPSKPEVFFIKYNTQKKPSGFKTVSKLPLRPSVSNKYGIPSF